MNEGQATDKLNDIATTAFQANISNPDMMTMDNDRFVTMYVNQIRKESRGGWNWKLASRYVDRLDGMMQRD